jgi:hypothetical protein
MSSSSIPVEVFLTHILPYLYKIKDLSALKQCILVSKDWFHWCSPFLWQTILLTTAQDCQCFYETLRDTKSFCDYGSLVKYLIFNPICTSKAPTPLSGTEVSDDADDHSDDDDNHSEDDGDLSDVWLDRFELVYGAIPLLRDLSFWSEITSKCRNLDTLDVAAVGFFAEHFDICLPLAKTIQQFLFSTPTLYDHPLLILEDSMCKFFKKSQNLTLLSIESEVLTDHAFISVLPNFSRLLRLDVHTAEASFYNDFCIIEICRHCTDLRVLNIAPALTERPSDITDAALEALVKHCPNLLCLSLPYTRISIDGIVQLVKKCSFLEFLNFQECPLAVDLLDHPVIIEETSKRKLMVIANSNRDRLL